jgi:multicomponent Na+:H+ antiporter subunit F
MTLDQIILVLLSVAIFLAFSRLARGPSLADRVVALDLITSLVVGVIAIYAVATDEPVYLDIALVLALITFLGTVAFARFIEKGELSWRKS